MGCIRGVPVWRGKSHSVTVDSLLVNGTGARILEYLEVGDALGMTFYALESPLASDCRQARTVYFSCQYQIKK